jgi:WD40 repeat protein
VDAVAFSPDGKLLASASGDRTVRVWPVDDGTFIRELRLLVARGALSNIVLSPNGELLASGDEDRTVRLWRVEDGTHLCVLEGHKKQVNAVAFSPDGKLIASGSDDRTVGVWGIVGSSNGPGD